MTISLLKFPIDTKLYELFNVLLHHSSSEAARGSWQLCRVSNRRTQGALERATPPPPSADGYLPMTAYNTTAES